MESWPSAVEVVGVEVGFDVGILGVAADVFGEGLGFSSWMYSLKTAQARYRRLSRRFLDGWKNRYWVSIV